MSFLNVILVVNMFFALFQFLYARKRYKQSEADLEYENEQIDRLIAFHRFRRSQLYISKPKFGVKVIKFNGEVIMGYLFANSKKQCEKRLARWSAHPYFCLYDKDDFVIEIKTEEVVFVKVLGRGF